MKKLLTIILLLIITLTVSGCMFIKDKTKSKAYDKSVEIIRCFDEEDSEGLKKLFCEHTRNSSDIDKEIEEAFTLYDGKSESFEFAYNGGVAGSWRDGKAIDEHIEPEIQDISTELGNIYRVYYHEYLTYEKDENCVGITHMIIFDENTDKKIQIGEYVY